MEEREAWSREGKVVQGGKYYYNRNRWNIGKHREYRNIYRNEWDENIHGSKNKDHSKQKVHPGCLHGG